VSAFISTSQISNVMLYFRELVRTHRTYSGVSLQTVANKVRPGVGINVHVYYCVFFSHSVTTANCEVSG